MLGFCSPRTHDGLQVNARVAGASVLRWVIIHFRTQLVDRDLLAEGFCSSVSRTGISLGLDIVDAFILDP